VSGSKNDENRVAQGARTERAGRRRLARMAAVAFFSGTLCAGAFGVAFYRVPLSALIPSVLSSASAQAARPTGTPAQRLVALKASFRRPAEVPFPSNDLFSEPKRALGEALFHDTRLSGNGAVSCATCHVLEKGFADGEVRGHGVSGQRLGRHTPTIWNLAGGVQFFWDGRARSLEEQVAGPIESADEMAQKIETLVATLSADKATAAAFATAFPDDPVVSRENVTKAIATYERTLVSPDTRFDKWIAGDATALTPSEIAGFNVFTGKGGCATCHRGFAFTDFAFHDIGLPGDDRGRGVILRLAKADHAFKTPGLRELGRSAPYMHDGSLATLEDVVRHYETGIVPRDTLSSDLPHGLKLTDKERGDLVAFLRSLTTTDVPQPVTRIVPGPSEVFAPVVLATTVTQQDRNFSPIHVAVKTGQPLWILNNDSRTHNVRVSEPSFDYDSGAQEPGETVQIAFPKEGSFLVYCGIHPKMELRVEVEAAK
jgi:cytochrome c peroxidase